MQTTDSAIITDMVHSAFTCLSCGDPLPRGRGGHCQACVEWGEPSAPIEIIDIQIDDINAPGSPVDLDPAPGRCPTCQNSGRMCWDCGSLDLHRIGEKIVYLMHHDRPTLLTILAGTPRKQWLLLARAYCAALGCTEAGRPVPADGVVELWSMLVKELAC